MTASATAMYVPLQLPLGIQLRETATLDSLVAGDNAQILAAITALAHGEQPINLYLWGPQGLGKSHMLQAVSRCVARTGRRSAYLPLVDIRDQPTSVLQGLAELDVLCLDDVQAIAGERHWEEALVGLFDQCRFAGCSILAAANKQAYDLDLSLKDLSSRLSWGAVYGLRDLSDTQKCEVLCKRATLRGLHMPKDVAEFLLRRFSRDLPTLLTLLDRLDHASLAAQRRLTIPFVKQALARE